MNETVSTKCLERISSLCYRVDRPRKSSLLLTWWDHERPKYLEFVAQNREEWFVYINNLRYSLGLSENTD